MVGKERGRAGGKSSRSGCEEGSLTRIASNSRHNSVLSIHGETLGVVIPSHNKSRDAERNMSGMGIRPSHANRVKMTTFSEGRGVLRALSLSSPVDRGAFLFSGDRRHCHSVTPSPSPPFSLFPSSIPDRSVLSRVGLVRDREQMHAAENPRDVHMSINIHFKEIGWSSNRGMTPTSHQNEQISLAVGKFFRIAPNYGGRKWMGTVPEFQRTRQVSTAAE